MMRIRILMLVWFSLTQVVFAAAPRAVFTVDPNPAMSEVPVGGRETKVKFLGDDNWVKSIKGELLAVAESELYILSSERISRVRQYAVYHYDGMIVTIPRNSIYKIEIQKYSAGAGRVLGWTLGGIISTVSHGYYLLLTVPLWLIFGSFSAMAIASANDIDFRPEQWKQLSKYARFPQGLPEGYLNVELHRTPSNRD